jgi:hypothetical protein
MSSAPFAKPDHVPAELVRDYDHVNGPEIMAFPPAAIDQVREDGRPTFFSSFHGGFWVLTCYEDIRAAFLDADLFPSGAAVSRRIRSTGCSSRCTSIRRSTGPTAG